MKARPIRIVPVMNGFVVEVGCKTLVAETKSKLISELDRYLSNPAAVEEEYFKRYEPGAPAEATQVVTRYLDPGAPMERAYPVDAPNAAAELHPGV